MNLFFFLELKFEIDQCCTYQNFLSITCQIVFILLSMHAPEGEIPFTCTFQVSKQIEQMELPSPITGPFFYCGLSSFSQILLPDNGNEVQRLQKIRRVIQCPSFPTCLGRSFWLHFFLIHILFLKLKTEGKFSGTVKFLEAKNVEGQSNKTEITK